MEQSLDGSGKRKQPPASTLALDRPKKHIRSDPMPAPPEQAPAEANGLLSGSEMDSDDGRMLPITSMTADSAEWQATIEKVVRNVVSIRFCQTCAFDTDPATSSEATGFVVDAERGYILTNRHVVGAGPFWGYCIFDNHEEVRFHTLQVLLKS